MTDSLRDRIACAICQVVQNPCLECLEHADAVIAELGLRVEKGQRSNATGPLWGSNNRHTVTRYVTEWTPDD